MPVCLSGTQRKTDDRRALGPTYSVPAHKPRDEGQRGLTFLRGSGDCENAALATRAGVHERQGREHCGTTAAAGGARWHATKQRPGSRQGLKAAVSPRARAGIFPGSGLGVAGGLPPEWRWWGAGAGRPRLARGGSQQAVIRRAVAGATGDGAGRIDQQRAPSRPEAH